MKTMRQVLGEAQRDAAASPALRTGDTHLLQQFCLMVDFSLFPTTYETSRFVIQTFGP